LGFRGVSVKPSSIEQVFGKKEDENTGIVWNTRIRVEEFIIYSKKFDAFSGMCLEIKERLGEAYEAGNQIRILVGYINKYCIINVGGKVCP
jgi:hypothetical protein